MNSQKTFFVNGFFFGSNEAPSMHVFLLSHRSAKIHRCVNIQIGKSKNLAKKTFQILLLFRSIKIIQFT